MRGGGNIPSLVSSWEEPRVFISESGTMNLKAVIAEQLDRSSNVHDRTNCIKLHQSVCSTDSRIPGKGKMPAMKILTFFLALVFLSSIGVLAEDDDRCVYTVFVKTGTRLGAGTDAKIGATFYTAEGSSIQISDFTSWGNLLEPNKDYFERYNLDTFGGLGDCLKGPICKMNLTSDGAGSHDSWFSDSVEITTAKFGEECSTHVFIVNRWLSTNFPYTLNFVKDDCGLKAGDSDSSLSLIRKYGEGR